MSEILTEDHTDFILLEDIEQVLEQFYRLLENLNRLFENLGRIVENVHIILELQTFIRKNKNILEEFRRY